MTHFHPTCTIRKLKRSFRSACVFYIVLLLFLHFRLLCIDSHVIGCLFLLFVICLLLEFYLYVLYYTRGKGDSPHQAGVFTRGEGSR
jgi:hypothetical protein